MTEGIKWPICLIIFVLCMGCTVSRRLKMSTLCSLPRGDICIPIRTCPYFADLLDSSPIPRPKSVIKIIREHQCGFQGNTPKVCCSLTPNSSSPSKLSDVSTNEVGLLPRSSCGAVSYDFRITSGSETSLLEFPWMALIAYDTENGEDFRCGGTVINNRYVLTAAHCLYNLTFLGVRLGEYDINRTVDCDFRRGFCAPPVQDFFIEEIILHSDYNPKTFENDIALIRLATPANLSFANVKPICLPLSDDMQLDGKFGIISGWGVTDNGKRSSVLLKTSIPVIPIDKCRRIYSNSASLTDHQICAGGYYGSDSCAGDSGGPLKYISKVNGVPRYVQYGIVSYGPKQCGTDGQPGIYTKVADYVDWILQHILPS